MVRVRRWIERPESERRLVKNGNGAGFDFYPEETTLLVRDVGPEAQRKFYWEPYYGNTAMQEAER